MSKKFKNKFIKESNSLAYTTLANKFKLITLSVMLAVLCGVTQTVTAQPGNELPYINGSVSLDNLPLQMSYDLPPSFLSPVPTTTVTPCISCCPNTPWKPTVYNDFRLQNGCIIRVFYTWRIACGAYYEVQVLEIRTMNQLCNCYSKQQLWNEAHRAIIAKNRMNFPIKNPGDCIHEYRVEAGTCWTVWELYDYLGNDISIEIPCENATTCCEINGDICVNQYGKLEFIGFNFDEATSNPHCDEKELLPGSYPPGLPACQPRCPGFKLSEYLPSIPPPLKSGERTETNSIKVNKNERNLSFEINCLQDGYELNVIVTDIMGHEVQNIATILNQSSNIITTNNLTNGVYIYAVYVDSKLLYSNKVIFK